MLFKKKEKQNKGYFNFFGKQTNIMLPPPRSFEDDKGDNEKKEKHNASDKKSTAIVFVFAFAFLTVLSIAACIGFLVDASAFVEFVIAMADIIKALCSVFHV